MPSQATLAKLNTVAELSEAGRHQEAVAILRRLVQSDPRSGVVNRWMGCELAYLNQFDQAIFYCLKALESDPKDVAVLCTLGNIFFNTGRLAASIDALKRAVEADPNHLEALCMLVDSLDKAKRLADVAVYADRALKLKDNLAEMYIYKGVALLETGHANESGRTFDTGLRKCPGYERLASVRCSASLYRDDLSIDEMAATAREYGSVVRAIHGPPMKRSAFERDRAPERRIRVGLICADLRRHSSAYFFQGLFDNLNAERYELCLYNTSRAEDDWTERLRARASIYRQCNDHDGQPLLKILRDDTLDVLIDASGHTSGDRLATMGLRAAPVQATWLAFPGTTGLRTMDYRLTDRFIDPPGPITDRLLTERALYIDRCFVCYTPPPDVPEVSPLPCLSSPNFTIGSFNASKKITDTTLRLWGRLLNAIPSAHLLMRMNGMEQAAARQAIIDRAAAVGLDTARLHLLPPVEGTQRLLHEYSRLDLALDPFPYHGTTTTCEAFTMGVPVLSLQGDRPASRVGGSLLSLVGLEDFIADSPEDFVARGVRIAADPPKLAAIRAELRQRVTGTLGDHAAYARRFEDAIRKAWRSYCAGELPDDAD